MTIVLYIFKIRITPNIFIFKSIYKMYFSLHIFRSMRIHSHLNKALFGYITPVRTQYLKKIKKHILCNVQM